MFKKAQNNPGSTVTELSSSIITEFSSDENLTLRRLLSVRFFAISTIDDSSSSKTCVTGED